MHAYVTLRNVIEMASIETITLSSDDEEHPPKRIKLTSLHKSNGEDKTLIILSDDEDHIVNKSKNHTENLKKDKPSKCNNNKITDSLASNAECSNVEEQYSETPACEEASNFRQFLDQCVKCVKNEDQKSLLLSKIPLIKKIHKCAGDYTISEEFSKMIDEKINILTTGSDRALQYFNDVYQTLKFAYANKNCCDENIPTDTKFKIIKLEKMLRKVNNIVKKLEVEEFESDDWDDKNSPYIKLQKYKERGAKIYEKICSLRKVNPHKERIIYRQLTFCESNYTEFNRTINKKYKNNNVFPTFYEMNKLLRKCAEEQNMVISETELALEIKHCFEAIGNLLQRRRKQDLYEVHSDYLIENDPAISNPELNDKLNANRKMANAALNTLCLQFVQKQEKGEPATSDSENSQPESDSEDNKD